MNSETAVIICAGPSLDAMPARVWERVAEAGAIVAVNGAIAAEACKAVKFTYVSAMDASDGLGKKVPRFDELWSTTPAWRLGMLGRESVPAETYIREVDERDGIEGWSDDPDAGYAGGSSAMVTANWLCNPDPDAPLPREREWVALSAAKGRVRVVPPRGFRRVAFLGLDMVPGQGGHARGAGNHTSGFAFSEERFARVSKGWEKVCRQAALRGIEIVNLTPGTGLRAMPRAELPR